MRIWMVIKDKDYTSYNFVRIIEIESEVSTRIGIKLKYANSLFDDNFYSHQHTLYYGYYSYGSLCSI